MGFYSVYSWHESEIHGNSDLRLYLCIQAFAILVTILMLLSSSPYDRNFFLAFVVFCYGLALLFDLTDHKIISLTGDIVSGHTLKHLMVGLAGFSLILMIRKRKIVRNL